MSKNGNSFMGMFSGPGAPGTFLTIIAITSVIGLNSMISTEVVKTDMEA